MWSRIGDSVYVCIRVELDGGAELLQMRGGARVAVLQRLAHDGERLRQAVHEVERELPGRVLVRDLLRRQQAVREHGRERRARQREVHGRVLNHGAQAVLEAAVAHLRHVQHLQEGAVDDEERVGFAVKRRAMTA